MNRISVFCESLRSVFTRFAGAPGKGGLWRRRQRALRLCETLSLGNRGFLAVVRYHEQQFLVGGTNTSIALLAQLAPPVEPQALEEGTKG